MNPQLTILDPATATPTKKSILAKDGFECSIIALAPGVETVLHESRDVEEHVLFVIEGEATVRFGDLNTMLNQDEAILIGKGKAHLIAASSDGGAKLLRVDVPPRQTVMPPIVTLHP